MKKMLSILLIIIIAIVVFFAVFLIYATVNDYNPKAEITVFNSKKPDMLSDTAKLDILIWNIGYCGLNSEMDFFYDGGEHVFPEKDIVINNLEGVKEYLLANENTDFILLQEVDKISRRSHKINQFDTISKLFPERNAVFGKNYDVFFVPQPVTKPMGVVRSGLMTISKYVPTKVTRHSFPGNYSWPVGLFFLDRCFLVNRFSLANEKELLIINTHNSAYDDGSLREQQMNYLSDFLTAEYKKGNYIIVGGDWNQCPPNFTPDFKENVMDNESRKDISPEFLNKWTWAYENSLPTNRRVATPYIKGESLTTVIDFYLLSPNIEKLSIENVNLNFKHSDHQPVKISIKLK